MRWLSKIRGMTKRQKLDAELDEELRSHLEMRAADEIRNGMNVRDARYDAQRRFGNFTMEKERTRSVTIFGWLETSFNDVRFGLRQLRRNPGFAAVAVLTLALGIGANTAMFTLLDQVLLRMLPVKNPQQLVLLTMRGRHYGNNWGGNAISYPMFKDFQEHNEVFSGMFCRFPTTASLSADGRSELVNAELVSGTYFDVLGVTTAVGRTFTPDDNKIPDGHPIVILSYGFWKQRFAADPAIVGKTVLINNNRMTVIGVAQQGFDGVELGYVPNIFVPLMMRKEIIPTAPLDMLTDRRTRWVNAFGRLKPGITRDRAKVALQPFMHSMLEMEVQEPAFSRASPLCPRAISESVHRCAARLAGQSVVPAATLHTALGADGGDRTCVADRVREHRKSFAGARHGTPKRNRRSHGHRREPRKNCSPVVDRNSFSLCARSARRIVGCILGRERARRGLSPLGFSGVEQFFVAQHFQFAGFQGLDVHHCRNHRHGSALRSRAGSANHETEYRSHPERSGRLGSSQRQ